MWRRARVVGASGDAEPVTALALPVSLRTQRVLVGAALSRRDEFVPALEARRRVAPLARGWARDAVVVLEEGVLAAHEADAVQLAGTRALLRDDADAVRRQRPVATD